MGMQSRLELGAASCRAPAVGERHERNNASALAFDAEPSPPMRPGDIADVRGTRVAVAALKGEHGRRHAPAGGAELAEAIGRRPR
jgi:hypothetical protein